MLFWRRRSDSGPSRPRGRRGGCDRRRRRPDAPGDSAASSVWIACGQSQALREAGADVVVTNLAQVKVAAEPPVGLVTGVRRIRPGARGNPRSPVRAGQRIFRDPRRRRRGQCADDVHYPGTYLAGGYNRLRTDIAGRVVENEDLVNFPNWLALTFRIADERMVRSSSTSSSCPTARSSISGAPCCFEPLRFEDGQGRRTHAHGAPPGLDERHAPGRAGAGADRRELVGRVTVRSAIDGRVVNARRETLSQVQQPAPGAAGRRGRWRGRRLSAGAHLPVEHSCRAGGANAGVRRRSSCARARAVSSRNRDTSGRNSTIDLAAGRRRWCWKRSPAFYTSRDHAISECGAGGAQGDCACGSLRRG